MRRSLKAARAPEFDKITSARPEPADFDKYWKARKRSLKKAPIKAELTLLPGKSNDKLDVYDVKLDCVGDPVRGYLSIPKNAAEKSLPAPGGISGVQCG